MIPLPDVTASLIYFAILVAGMAIGVFIEHWLMVQHELQFVNLVLKQPTPTKQLLLVMANNRDKVIIAQAQARIDKRKQICPQI